MRKLIAFASSILVAACGSSGGTGDAGTDALASDAATVFQPSNVTLADIAAQTASAGAEDIMTSCKIDTAKANPDSDCFSSSSIVAVTQSDSSVVNLVVVKSLEVAAAAVVRVTGEAPLVIVSLGDMTVDGTIDAHSALLDTGPGGAAQSDANANGGGAGGGPGASGTATVGGSGGSFCGVGGIGGGNTAGTAYGTSDDRPLVGGSAGGGGAVGGGAGGGAVQLVAYGTLTISSTGAVNVGGQGGLIGGLSADQNAGGGGSGGAILLEAPTVDAPGTLAANGGGGGGDYASPSGGDGSANATAASGGAAGSSDAAGGNGSAATTITGAPGGAGTASLNAGGGGGGAGRIRINSSNSPTLGTLSPAQSTTCVSLGAPRTSSAGP